MASVTDSGKGISAEHLKKIFDPFFTTKGPLGKSDIQGTGLGLSVCYTLVSKHGGTIYSESAKGKGTKFIITLPIKKGKNSKVPEFAICN